MIKTASHILVFSILAVFAATVYGAPHIATEKKTVTASIQKVSDGGHTIQANGKTYAVTAATHIHYAGNSKSLPPKSLLPRMTIRFTPPRGNGQTLTEIIIPPQ